MRYLLFDPFHGAAGDMITGSLLALGADRELVIRAMRSVVGDPSITMVEKKGVLAIQVRTNATNTTRTFNEVLDRVKQSDAPGPAIDMAVRVFERISAAEISVHGGGTHFHEVGADDAVADVIGACTALHSLCPDEVSVRPVAAGGGTIHGSHGVMPVPAPATLAIFEESRLSVQFGSVEDGELCTPTGAALLAEFQTTGKEPPGPGTIIATGYGAGTRDTGHMPNVLRAVLLEVDGGFSKDCISILETNVDDVSGEVIGNTITALMNAGARDASAIPCIMKKGRPGYLVRVISLVDTSEKIATVMAEELGTLGIRYIPTVHRFIAERSVEKVTAEINGQLYEAPVKCGWLDGRCYMIKAEFDIVQEIARKSGIPAREVAMIIEEQARRENQTGPAGDRHGSRKTAKRKS